MFNTNVLNLICSFVGWLCVKSFANFIVRHKVAVLLVFLALMIPSLLGILLTRENYDILSYMPGDLNSRQGEVILEQEFKLSGYGLVVISGKENWQVLDVKSRIESVPGVDQVLWLDTYENITVPAEFMDLEIRDRFFSGDSTILQVLFKENSRSGATREAVVKIREIIGDAALFGGEPVIINDLQTTTSREMIYYMLIGLVCIYLVLSASMTSFLEPVLFLVSIGIAIVLNMGSNIIRGEISFITGSIAAVMQLGVSMDYSIFLLHRFEEEKQKFPSIEGAMVSALSKTGMPVAASALTTLAGFLALMFMKNGIGSDLGFVLGKGILFSLLVNMTVIPGLILIFSRFADKHRHKPILPTFHKLSRWILKYRWVFFAVMIVVSVPSYLAQKNLDYYYTNEHYLPDTSRSVADSRKAGELFGATEIAYVIIPDEGRVREKELMDQIKTIPVVDSVLGLSEQVEMAVPEDFIPDAVKDQFKNGKYRYFQVFITTSADDPRTFDAIDQMRKSAGLAFNEYYVTGSAALARDMASLVDTDTRNVTFISIGLILLILALSFQSLSLPFLLVLAIELAVWVNLGIPYFQGTAVSSMTSIVIGAIQLGATVDYAILFTSRYRENLDVFQNKLEAMRQTITDTGRSILTSALTMLSATLGISVMASIKTTGELSLMIGRGAIISMMVIFLGLPSILLIMDGIISKTTRNWK